MKKIFRNILLIAGLGIGYSACENEPVGPILGDASTFINPVISNPATTDPTELLADNATDVYEKFEWTTADYGISLPANYVLSVDTSDAFTKPVVLGSGAITSLEVSVEEFNEALLKLGLPGFEENTVSIRASAAVTGGNIENLNSQIIHRTVTTYQDSDCGTYCTVGLIGSASPGDWGTDTDMRLNDPERIDKNTWTLTVFLKGGKEVKFRANDDWAVNWGAADFPSGTGTQGGANIPIPADDYYKVTFNDITGEYSFTALSSSVYTTVGIIGSGTAGGWDSDTDLTKDTLNTHIWKAEVTLTDGEAKFRAENDWAANWGAKTYPSGYATGGGSNIPVKAGTYFVCFNDATGEYAFMDKNDKTPYTTIGIIGSATPGGWDTDTDLIQNPSNPYRWSVIISLTEAETKFRADNDWAVNWGGVGLPSGIGIKNGPNIAVKEGKYTLHFHTGTGEYAYLK
jgi:hypothetical protein